MDEFHIKALGTNWVVLVDGAKLDSELRQRLTTTIQTFEATYSRFKSDSTLSQLNRDRSDQLLPISEELEKMLKFGLQLSKLTEGLFDANVASWESAYGYNEKLHFKPIEEVELPAKGWFELGQRSLIKHGLVEIDLGAFGKGFLIDLLAEILEFGDLKYYLIDGGRDFYGTSKANGSAWKIALEHPTDAMLAIGVAELKHQALAASNSFHRRVGKFHHLLNGQTGQPAQELASVFVVAKTAMEADGLSTALFVSPPQVWTKLKTEYEFEYLTVTQNLKSANSALFPGKIFLS